MNEKFVLDFIFYDFVKDSVIHSHFCLVLNFDPGRPFLFNDFQVRTQLVGSKQVVISTFLFHFNNLLRIHWSRNRTTRISGKVWSCATARVSSTPTTPTVLLCHVSRPDAACCVFRVHRPQLKACCCHCTCGRAIASLRHSLLLVIIKQFSTLSYRIL